MANVDAEREFYFVLYFQIMYIYTYYEERGLA